MPLSDEQIARIERVKELSTRPTTLFDLNTVGAEVAGIVVELSEGELGYGPYPVVVIDTRTELVAVHAHRTVLQKKIVGRDLRLGDAISIKYEGERKSKSGTQYHDYAVRIVPAPRDETPRIPSVEDDESF